MILDLILKSHEWISDKKFTISSFRWLSKFSLFRFGVAILMMNKLIMKRR
jgi:hypothetical protein